MKEYSEEIQRLLKDVVAHYDKEDRSVRERQIREWRKLKLMWDGFTQIYYSEVAHDWRIWAPEDNEDDNSQQYYDKQINIFRAYLESIIAALSVTTPAIKCFPDDADNTLDLETAKAGDKIAQLIYRHNNVPLLWLKALYVFCTEGMVACYNYTKSDKEYGTYKNENWTEVEEHHEISSCPICGMQIQDEIVESFTNAERDEFNPGDGDAELHNLIINQNQQMCPQCGAMIDPELQQSTLIIPKLVGVTHEAKSRQCMEVYGGLYVKTATYAMKQADTPYLMFCYETHFANVIEKYPHLHEKLHQGSTKVGTPSGVNDAYEQWGRLSTQYRGEYPLNAITVRNNWLRNASFNCLNKEDADKLKKEFPDGARVVLINEEFAEAENESLDDSWTLSVNPLSDYLQHDPLGKSLISVQEITNDLISLILQTIEHGIPQTFADPSVLDFDAYRQLEAIPGGMFSATPKTGKSVSDGFYQTKTATLSQEVMPFGEKVQQLGQLASGATPSIFGGNLTESKTASEYAMSRSQALQRLQNTWKIFTMWWKEVFGKVIPAYMDCIKEDEREVSRDNQGNFVNSFIRIAELQGKIGKIELEANENLPQNWQQIKDTVMQLIQTNNPEMLSILGDPQNLPVVREAIGLVDFYVPGEDDRNKQNEETKLLLNSEPVSVPSQDPMTGMMTEQQIPSIEVDPDIDNNQIEFETCRVFLISPAGRLAKVENPKGYQNVLLHARMHQQAMMAMQMQQQQAQNPQQQASGGQPNGPPIQENSDVRTVQ